MKKNVRNALAISGLALAIGASGLTLEASANMNKSGRGMRFERQQNPSKIIHLKKVERTVGLHRRTLPGIVTSVSTDSITISKGGKDFIVNIATETRILSRNWQTIDFSSIQNGDKIRVFGTLTGTTIAAQ